MDKDLTKFLRENARLSELESLIKKEILSKENYDLKGVNFKENLPNLDAESLRKIEYLMGYYGGFRKFSSFFHEGTQYDLALSRAERFSIYKGKTYYERTKTEAKPNIARQKAIESYDRQYNINHFIGEEIVYNPPRCGPEQIISKSQVFVGPNDEDVAVSDVKNVITPPELATEVKPFFNHVHSNMSKNVSEIIVNLAVGDIRERINNPSLKKLQDDVIFNGPLFKNREWVGMSLGEIQSRLVPAVDAIVELDRICDPNEEIKINQLKNEHNEILKRNEESLLRLNTKFNALYDARIRYRKHEAMEKATKTITDKDIERALKVVQEQLEKMKMHIQSEETFACYYHGLEASFQLKLDKSKILKELENFEQEILTAVDNANGCETSAEILKFVNNVESVKAKIAKFVKHYSNHDIIASYHFDKWLNSYYKNAKEGLKFYAISVDGCQELFERFCNDSSIYGLGDLKNIGNELDLNIKFLSGGMIHKMQNLQEIEELNSKQIMTSSQYENALSEMELLKTAMDEKHMLNNKSKRIINDCDRIIAVAEQ